jgi:hypothetical protein
MQIKVKDAAERINRRQKKKAGGSGRRQKK